MCGGAETEEGENGFVMEFIFNLSIMFSNAATEKRSRHMRPEY